MKKRSNISFGPGTASLILIFVVLTLSALGMLSLMNARNDRTLSVRSAGVLERVYALNAQAEKARATLDGVLWELQNSGELNEETYLGALTLLKDAASQLDGQDEYASLTDAMAAISDSDASETEKDAALKALIALSADRALLMDSLRLLGETEIEDGVISWTQTDSADELAVSDEVYGRRTLSCALKVLPLKGEARTQWISYRLNTALADESDEAFFGD